MSLQELCARGQELLIATDYIGAEATLVEAESIALRDGDFDTLARLYMPLQEARRQRRQRCGEGIVKLDLIGDVDPLQIVDKYPHGQLLIAGWMDPLPAIEVRELAQQRRLYLETFIATAIPSADGGKAVILFPLLGAPPAAMLHLDELPTGEQRGDAQTFAYVMKMWEQLHAPFLAAGDARSDLYEKIQTYRLTIDVDYACELAHQRLSATAHELARARAGRR